MARIPVNRNFETVDQIYISLTESNANHPYILAAVKQCIGEDYVVVTSDGFEIKESNGTEGKIQQRI